MFSLYAVVPLPEPQRPVRMQQMPCARSSMAGVSRAIIAVCAASPPSATEVGHSSGVQGMSTGTPLHFGHVPSRSAWYEWGSIRFAASIGAAGRFIALPKCGYIR